MSFFVHSAKTSSHYGNHNLLQFSSIEDLGITTPEIWHLGCISLTFVFSFIDIQASSCHDLIDLQLNV
jgi:hypothetical protein